MIPSFKMGILVRQYISLLLVTDAGGQVDFGEQHAQNKGRIDTIAKIDLLLLFHFNPCLMFDADERQDAIRKHANKYTFHHVGAQLAELYRQIVHEL